MTAGRGFDIRRCHLEKSEPREIGSSCCGGGGGGGSGSPRVQLWGLRARVGLGLWWVSLFLVCVFSRTSLDSKHCNCLFIPRGSLH